MANKDIIKIGVIGIRNMSGHERRIGGEEEGRMFKKKQPLERMRWVNSR